MGFPFIHASPSADTLGNCILIPFPRTARGHTHTHLQIGNAGRLHISQSCTVRSKWWRAVNQCAILFQSLREKRGRGTKIYKAFNLRTLRNVIILISSIMISWRDTPQRSASAIRDVWLVQSPEPTGWPSTSWSYSTFVSAENTQPYIVTLVSLLATSSSLALYTYST